MASNLEAARSGDRRLALERLRDTLAASMDTCEPNMHAQLAGQYRLVLNELAGVANPLESTVDDLKAKRAARQRAARRATSTAKAAK